MWVESFMQIGDHAVRLSVEQLQEDVRDRTAAVLAWLTLETLREDNASGEVAWHECVADLVRQHVSFVVTGASCSEDLGSEWWNEAVGLAFLQFVRDNELAPVVHQHIVGIRTVDGLGRRGA